MRVLLWLPLLLLLAGCPDPPQRSLQTPPDDAPPADAPADDGGDAGAGRVGTMGESKDVVCGMSVSLNGAQHTHTVGDTVYLFCSEACLKKFQADPKKYGTK